MSDWLDKRPDVITWAELRAILQRLTLLGLVGLAHFTFLLLILAGIQYVFTGSAVPPVGPIDSFTLDVPPWFLLWTYGVVQLAGFFPPSTAFPSSQLAIGIFLILLPFVLFLSWPFIDRNFGRRLRTAIGAAAISSFIALSVYSVRFFIF